MQTSLSPLPVKIRHTADGIATSYSCAIEFTSNSFLEVYLDGEIQPTGWSYDVENKQVIFDVAPAEGVVINFLRQTPVSYEKGIAEKGIINPEVLDNQSVNLVAMIQEVEEKLDRVPILPVNTDLDSGSIFSEFERLEKNASISAEEALQAVTEIEDLREETINSMNGVVKSSKDSITAHTEIMSNKLEAESNTYIQEAKNWAEDAKVSASEASLNNLKNKITNCITEIPQDIKYAVTGNVLSVKAGSKVYFPYGVTDLSSTYPRGTVFLNSNFVVDATYYKDGKFYVGVIVQNDTTMDSTSQASTNRRMVTFTAANGKLASIEAGAYLSGATEPSDLGSSARFFNTTTNYIYNAGTTTYHSFPLVVGQTTNGTGWTSVDQVFNGFGFVGSTFFALPGVKGLTSNGRNEDGSLKNKEFIYNEVRLATASQSNGTKCIITSSYTIESGAGWAESNTETEGRAYAKLHPWTRVLCKDTNRVVVFHGTDLVYQTRALVGFYTTDTTNNITSFTPKLPFRAVDQNDFNKLDEEVTTLDAQNVKLTGNQTISGEKTFTSNIVRRGAFNTIGLNITKATDTNGKGEANNIAYYAGNTIYNRLISTNKTANKTAYFDVMARDDGTGIIQNGGSAPTTVNFQNTSAFNVPTPAASDNSTKAATTAWVNTRLGGKIPASIGSATRPVYTNSSGVITAGTQLEDGAYRDVFTLSAVSHSDYANKGKLLPDIGFMSYWNGAYNASNGSNLQYAKTPATSSNTNEIATTAWVNSRITSSMSSNDYVIETYRSGTNWYRIYKSGWIEQGGTTGEIATGNSVTVTFLKAFNDANYTLLGMAQYGQNKLYRIAYQTKTTTSVLIRNTDTDYKTPAVNWFACGMKA